MTGKVDISHTEINPEYITDELIQFREELEHAINNVGTAKTYKDTNLTSDYLQPYVPVHLARYAYRHSSTLRCIVESFNQDIYLNNYSLSDPEEDTTSIDNLWNKTSNKIQLYLAGIENTIYGYGACEIIDNGINPRLSQIPAHTLKLKKIPFTHPITNRTYYYYYAEQTVNGHTILLRLSNYDYSMLDELGIDHNAQGTCLWLGGCNENPFFDIPKWIAKRRALFTDIAIDEYNSRKIEKGNIASGFLLITGPLERKDPEHPEEKTIDEKVEDDFKHGNTGLIVNYIGATSTSHPVDMKYQIFEDNNYEYFSQLQDRCINDLLRAFKMPKVRLAVDDTKESMNSHKSDTLYEIYNREIWASQMFVQTKLDNYNQVYNHVKSDMVISTPEFTDKTSTRITIITELFNEGLLTLAQCFTLLAPIYPEIDFTENKSYSEDVLNTRFYHGQPLGSQKSEYEEYNQVDNLINGLNSILSEDNQSTLENIKH